MKPGVGIIGLGIMGKRMAENLLKAGFSLSEPDARQSRRASTGRSPACKHAARSGRL